MTASNGFATRFAPSPTGDLHLGGARTALFAWLAARSRGGTVALRIEDTDSARSEARFERAIREALHWLGLDFDQVVRQSERTELYQSVAQRLMAQGHLYGCDCSPERLAQVRDQQRRDGATFVGYDGRCRERRLGWATPSAVLRFRVARGGDASLHLRDSLRGDLTQPVASTDDFIVRRANGAYTYNFACVVDDRDMGITHVLRGDDHLGNSFKQVLLYRALEVAAPTFTHVPQVLAANGARLSKRDGARSVLAWRDEGYPAAAILNLLARLGWSCGDKELWTLAELRAKFADGTLQRTAARLELDRLDYLSRQHLKHMSPEQLVAACQPYATAGAHDSRWPALLTLWCPRARQLAELASMAQQVLTHAPSQAVRAHPVVATVAQAWQGVAAEQWQAPVLAAALAEVHRQLGGSFAKVGKPVRAALCGCKQSPPLSEVALALGRERTLARLGG